MSKPFPPFPNLAELAGLPSILCNCKSCGHKKVEECEIEACSCCGEYTHDDNYEWMEESDQK